MRKIKLFLSLLMVMLLSVGNVWAETVTMSYSAGSTTNMGAGNNATTVGLSATAWTVTADKGGQNNYPGLNKSNYIALYAGSNSSQNGASITVSIASGTISSIVINYKSNTGTVYAGSTPVTLSDGKYTINGSAFTVKNTLSSGQVQINSIVITYTTGGSDPVSVAGVSLDKDEIQLEVGATQTLVATVEPSGATDQVVSWASDDESVATVDENGVVTAEGIGTATITVTTHDGGFTATCDVEVIAAQPKSSLIFTAACGGSGTATPDNVAWSITSDAAESTYEEARGIHYGTGSKPVEYIELTSDPFTNKVKKIEVEAAGNSTPSLSITVGGNAFGEAATGITTGNVKYTFEPTQAQSSTDFTGVIVVRLAKASAANGALYIKSIVVTYEEAAPAAVATPEISATGDDYGKTITITAEDGAEIYYTLNGDIPTATSTHYTAPFALTESKTVKAIAIKNEESSNVASETYTIYPTYSTIAQLKANAVNNTPKDIRFVFSDIQVTYINGALAYISDGNEGALIYKSNIGNNLSVGQIINGTLNTKLQGYFGDAELTEFDATNLTITDGTVPVQTKSLATDNLTTANISMVVDLGLLTYDATNVAFKDDNNNSIKYNNKFNVSNLPTLENGAQYNVKGLLISYSNALNIAPRSEDDITVPATTKSAAETQWVANSKTVRMGDETTDWWSTESDGAKSFSSTNEDVATINATTGAITLVAPGTTTLKFSTAESDTYFAGPEVSMVLTVKSALPTGGIEFTWVAGEKGYMNAQEVTTATDENADPVTIVFAQGEGSNAPKYYTSGSAVRSYAQNTLAVSSNTDDYLLYEVEIKFESASDNKLEGNGLSVSGTTGTWSGVAEALAFSVTNASGNQARIVSINAVYAPGTVTELAIADINLKTTDGETALGITKNVDATINYTGLNESVATIADNKVTPVGIGSTTVTASIAAGSNYTAASTTFKITVAAKAIPEMSFPQPSYNINLGETFDAPELTKPDGVSVTYSSDNAAVSVDENTGAITLNAEGTAVITATSVETGEYAVGTATYTLNVTDPYKDVLTAVAIGKTSYETWNNKTFTTDTKYAGNNTTGTGTYANTLQMRVQNPSGIVNTSTIGYLKEISATATKNGDNTLDIYAKNTPYESSADLYDNDKRGTLIGTIAADGGEIDFEDGFAYSDNYKYIGIKAKGGAVYYDEIVIKWTPATINKYTVTYKAGEAEGDDVVINNVEEGTPITLAAADTYSKEGYTFMGWNDGTDTYTAGDSYTVNDDVTFTAQWAQNFTVTYKAGEATGDDVVRTVPAGAYNLESCSFVYANHAFDGWQNGSNKYNAGAEVNISGNMEFVATWVEAMDPITVTFTAGTDKSSSLSIYKNGIKIAVSSGTLNNDDDYRCYASNHMTVSSELGNITQIVITSTSSKPANAFSIEGDNGNYAYESLVGTWTGSSASIQLNASSQVRMTQIQVTYIPSAYLRNVTDANNFGTLCLPFNGTIEGAELLEFVDKDADNVYLGSSDATVQAGKPYIFRSTAAQIKVSFTDNNFVAATDNNGLYGTYVRMENEELNGKYLISNNQYYFINTDDCSLKAYRAYFVMSEVPGAGSNNARRRYAIGNGAPQVVTGIDELNASETPVKIIIDGQLFIIRGEKMYNVNGQVVK